MTDGLPQPESGDLGRYLEDTITIDWQTPSVTETGRRLVEGVESPEARVERIFAFVRDEIADSFAIETDVRTCRASEVLRERTGVSHAQSHLLAALLRFAGFPTGFCHARLRDPERPDRFVLHGFNAVHWAPLGASRSRETRTGGAATGGAPTGGWIYLDATGRERSREPESGGAPGSVRESACRFEPPWQLACAPDVERGETFLPWIHRRPARRIVELLERAPSLDAIRRSLPDAID